MRILHRYKKNPCNVQYSIDTGDIEYGLLYNWYASTDARNIANTGFHIATYDDVSTLIDFINSPGDDGGKLKETGFSYWDSPNTGATNEYGFNWRGSGGRGDDGSFWDLKAACYLWNIGESDSRFTFETSSFESVASNNERYQSYELVRGASLRVVKDSTTLSHGETGTYTGNDGKIYPTICIGTQEWVAENLAETKYRNGDTIPEVTDNTTWAGLITGALCAYDNDWNYVGTTLESDTINYTLISGELPITVELIGNTTHTNNHIILESGSFTDIPGGTYTFKVTDALGCEESEIIEIPYSEPIALNSSYDIDRKTLETCTVFKGFDYTVFGFTGETMFDRVKITSVPTNGTLSRGLLDTILVNDELIYPSDFNNGLYYRTSSIEKVDYSDTIGFQVRVNGLWSNTATITINVNSCIFADDCIEYGYLYNWYAVSDVRNIANEGWHAMTWDDMMNLLNYVTGGSYTSLDASDSLGDGYGGELKKTGTTYWQNPNINATDEYGFGAVGGGFRVFGGSFLGLNEFFSIYTFNREQSTTNPPHIYEVGSLIITNSTTLGYDFVFGFNQDSELFYGRNLRLVSDTPATGLPDGTTGIYTGNDGKNYSTVVINEKWWLAENLAETQYRNGDPIPTVEDNATWAGLTTGAKCAYDNNYEYVGCDETGDELTTYPTIEYGLLYNWYAATDARNIVNTGWHVPTYAEVSTLFTALGGTLVAGGSLKETGLTNWRTPNTGATNSSLFNARGSGTRRITDGTFIQIMNWAFWWTSSLYDATHPWHFRVQYKSDDSYFNEYNEFTQGHALRLLKDSTTLFDGETGTYTGNDGKVYRTICIGNQEWVADNLAETKYRNGDIIPEVTDNTEWRNLTTGALCAYNNDWNNVGRTKPDYY